MSALSSEESVGGDGEELLSQVAQSYRIDSVSTFSQTCPPLHCISYPY